MTLRTTMTDLILKLRGMTDTSSADYSINSISYWSDAHLQDVLDQVQMHVNFMQMEAIPSIGSSLAITYTRHETGLTDWENAPIIQDENGATIADTNYTFDANTGVVIFNTNTTGIGRYITGYVYNVERAASSVWTKKAAHAAKGFDFSTDNHSIKRSQVAEHYMDMSRFYDRIAGARTISIYRGDDVV